MSALIYSYAYCSGWLTLALFGVILFPQGKPANDPAANLIINRFEKVAGEFYRRADDVSAKKISITKTTVLENDIRKQLITFQVDIEDEVPAVLLVPPKAKANGAAILCLPDYLKGPKDSYSGDTCLYAKELAERGYVTLVPDYPGFGKYNKNYNPYLADYDSCTMKAIHNHIGAINVLKCMNIHYELLNNGLVRSGIYVDPQKIGCIGHGSGGYNALFFAMYSNRIGAARINAVGISSGLTTTKNYNGGSLSEWSKLHLMPWIGSKYDNNPQKLPFDFPELLSTLAPLPIFISAPLKDSEFNVTGTRQCIDYAEKTYAKQGFQNRIEALFPDCGQEFPKDVRERMYEFFDKQLLYRGDTPR